MVSEFIPVPSNKVDFIWEKIGRMLEQACETNNGRLPVEALYQNLKNKDMQLWISVSDKHQIECCCVTEIINYPNKKYCQVVIGTGSHFHNWVGFMRRIEDWAKQQGCDGIQSIARKGWGRVLKEQGWQQTHIFIEKEI